MIAPQARRMATPHEPMAVSVSFLPIERFARIRGTFELPGGGLPQFGQPQQLGADLKPGPRRSLLTDFESELVLRLEESDDASLGEEIVALADGQQSRRPYFVKHFS